VLIGQFTLSENGDASIHFMSKKVAKKSTIPDSNTGSSSFENIIESNLDEKFLITIQKFEHKYEILADYSFTI
jgi:hypothetical protein